MKLHQAAGDPKVYAGAPGVWWHVPNPEYLSILSGPAAAGPVIRVNSRQRDVLRAAYLAMRPSVDPAALAAQLVARLPKTAGSPELVDVERVVRSMFADAGQAET